MDAVADRADDFVQVDRSSEQAKGLAVGRAVQQMVKRSLQVGHRAAGLGDKVPAGYDNDDSARPTSSRNSKTASSGRGRPVRLASQSNSGVQI